MAKRRRARSRGLAGAPGRATTRRGAGSLQASFACSITANEPVEGTPLTGAFELIAYTGEPMNLDPWMWDRPVVVDLASLVLDQQRLPVLYDHTADIDYVVGQSEALEVLNGRLVVRGKVMPQEGNGYKQSKSQQILNLARSGYQWQVSIGADPRQVDKIEAGASVNVNGRVYNGPVAIARNTILREVSFVVLGADRGTSAVVAGEGGVMSFEEWMLALGFDAEALGAMTDIQRANMQLLWQEEMGEQPADDSAGAPTGLPTDNTNPPASPAGTLPTAGATAAAPAPTVTAPRSGADPLAASRRTAAAEIERQHAITALGTRYAQPSMQVGGRTVLVVAHAIESGWTAERTELHMMRAARPQAVAFTQTGVGDALALLGAALAQSCRMPREHMEALYQPPVLQAAHDRYRGRMGLQQFLVEAAHLAGWTGSPFLRSDAAIKEVLTAAFSPALKASTGFSTLSLPGILSNNVNKFLLAGYMGVDQSWREIAGIRAVQDFKVVTSYRPNGGFQFEEVGPTGEIKHETLGEEAYTNQARTYARMFAVTRQDIINDDLGALNDVPRRLGRGGGLKLADVFWFTWLANANAADGQPFWSVAHNNYIVGATTNLQSSSLTSMEQKLRDQVDKNGYPMSLTPAILLTPTSLARTAIELMASASFVVGGGNTATGLVPTTNTWQGSMKPVASPYIGNATYTGNTVTGFWVLANPADVPSVEVAFLNGNETPIVETADADFNTLGIQMRGYFDFGVAMQDWRGSAFSKGSA